MANDLSESFLDVPDSDEEEGLLNFSQYYFKEWSEIEALYKLTMYNESLDEKEEECAAETSQSDDDSDMDSDSSDDEEDYIDRLGNELDNMILSKPNLLYENPIRVHNRFQTYAFGNNRVTARQGWIWRPDKMDDESFESSSSDDETSSLSD